MSFPIADISVSKLASAIRIVDNVKRWRRLLNPRVNDGSPCVKNCETPRP